LYQVCKLLEAPVIRFLDIVGKTASRQLATSDVITQAVAADPFARTAAIATVAVLQVLCLLAFHGRNPFLVDGYVFS